jgi:hypothetical protein
MNTDAPSERTPDFCTRVRPGACYVQEVVQLLEGIICQTEPVERAFGMLEQMIDRLDALVGDGPLE